MILDSEILLRIAVFFCGLSGLLIALHIHQEKKDVNRPFVCPMNFDCNAVVRSDYSKLFGIPLEYFGMAYYGLIALSYLAFSLLPALFPVFLVPTLALLSVIAFLFSIYLIVVQVVILKKGCFWCFISAFVSITIFILTTISYTFEELVKILIP